MASQGSEVSIGTESISFFDTKGGRVEFPMNQITRIESRDFGRFTAGLVHHSVLVTKELSPRWSGSDRLGLKILGLVPIPPVWGIAAALAPLHILADGLALALPKRHYEIIH